MKDLAGGYDKALPPRQPFGAFQRYGALVKFWTIQEVQGDAGSAALRSRRFEAHYLASGLQMGNADVLPIRRRRENGQGESLTLPQGSGWIYVKIDAAQADVPEDSLTLKGGARIRPATMILQRQGNPYPLKPPSFRCIGHEVTWVRYNRDQAAGSAGAAPKGFWRSPCPSRTPKSATVDCLTDGIIAPVCLHQK
jgi:hypothetical protein